MSIPSHPSIIPRFEGEEGKKKLIDVLKRQSLVAGDENLAIDLANNIILFECIPLRHSPFIINQGDADNDIFFIIAGSVSIHINGRFITTRQAGTHVGEMALIDCTARRSATVTAIEPSLFGRVTEKDFSELAKKYPQLWRHISVEIAARLRERSKYIRQPHNESVVFIGSASEQLEICREIELAFSHDPMVVKVWTGIFNPSKIPIEDLITMVDDADFAILVISPDDIIESRGVEMCGPRDNVLFELGLFMGGINRERTFIVKPRNKDIKIASDLIGIKPLEYVEGQMETISNRLGPVCTELRRIILKIGPK